MPPVRKSISKAKAVPKKTEETKEVLNTESRRAEEYELIQSVKELFDKEGTGLIDAEELRLLLRSLGNKLSSVELGVISRFEDKEGKVPYEKLIQTILFE